MEEGTRRELLEQLEKCLGLGEDFSKVVGQLSKKDIDKLTITVTSNEMMVKDSLTLYDDAWERNGNSGGTKEEGEILLGKKGEVIFGKDKYESYWESQEHFFKKRSCKFNRKEKLVVLIKRYTWEKNGENQKDTYNLLIYLPEAETS